MPFLRRFRLPLRLDLGISSSHPSLGSPIRFFLLLNAFLLNISLYGFLLYLMLLLHLWIRPYTHPNAVSQLLNPSVQGLRENVTLLLKVLVELHPRCWIDKFKLPHDALVQHGLALQ